MNRIRSFLLALLMAASSLFITANDVTPVSAAAVSNCSRGGQYYAGGTYLSIICFYGIPGESIRMTGTCRYRLFGIYHTYKVYGVWRAWRYYDPATSYPGAPGSTGWSTASCGNHTHDGAYGDPHRDRLIHAAPQTSPSSSYWGWPFVF